MSPSLVLSGPPGVGKSTLVSAVAKRLGLSAVDLDVLVKTRTSRTPAEIIREDGESAFRQIEVEALRSLDERPKVVALGGGTLTTREGRKAARMAGPVVGLSGSLALLRTHLENDGSDRPLLSASEDGSSKLEALLAERKTSYAAVDRQVEVVGDQNSVVDRVVAAAQDLDVIPVEVGASQSRVLVGAGLEEALAGAVADTMPTRPVIAILDEGVPAEARARYLEPVQALFPTTVIGVPGGEAVKTWSSLGRILEQALEAGGGRQSTVIGLGGGATCDLAGLVASLLARGAPLVLVPSTLLAQVDASVGGKCAVNAKAGRNLIGAFHAAAHVIADTDLLKSLPEEEMRSGLAELVKIAIIRDGALFDALVDAPGVTSSQIASGIRHKAAIVGSDPFEAGPRKLLNLGHTLGHCLEAASNYGMRHGEAVAIGIAAMARWSAQQGWTTEAEAVRIVDGLQKLGLPTGADRALLGGSASHLRHDKKGTDRATDLIGIQRVGKTFIRRVSLGEVAGGLISCGEDR